MVGRVRLSITLGLSINDLELWVSNLGRTLFEPRVSVDGAGVTFDDNEAPCRAVRTMCPLLIDLLTGSKTPSQADA